MKNIACQMLTGVIIVLWVLLLPLNASANGPAPADCLSFSLKNLPEDVAFADILIQIDPEDSKYTQMNMRNFVLTGLPHESEIILYDTDGFRSYTFHYKDASSSIDVYGQYDGQQTKPDNAIGYVQFCKGTEYREFYTQYEDLRKNYNTMKLALLNEKGEIISLSEKFDLPKENSFHMFLGDVTYDYLTGDIEMSISDNYWFVLIYGFLAMFLTALSVGIESITAFFFNYKGKKMTLIVIVNLISQTIMRTAYLILIIFSFPHLLATILLEVCVYSAEYMVYRKSKAMAGESVRKLLIYTVTANSLSLIAIALLNVL